MSEKKWGDFMKKLIVNTFLFCLFANIGIGFFGYTPRIWCVEPQVQDVSKETLISNVRGIELYDLERQLNTFITYLNRLTKNDLPPQKLSKELLAFFVSDRCAVLRNYLTRVGMATQIKNYIIQLVAYFDVVHQYAYDARVAVNFGNQAHDALLDYGLQIKDATREYRKNAVAQRSNRNPALSQAEDAYKPLNNDQLVDEEDVPEENLRNNRHQNWQVPQSQQDIRNNSQNNSHAKPGLHNTRNRFSNNNNNSRPGQGSLFGHQRQDQNVPRTLEEMMNDPEFMEQIMRAQEQNAQENTSGSSWWSTISSVISTIYNNPRYTAMTMAALYTIYAMTTGAYPFNGVQQDVQPAPQQPAPAPQAQPQSQSDNGQQPGQGAQAQPAVVQQPVQQQVPVEPAPQQQPSVAAPSGSQAGQPQSPPAQPTASTNDNQGQRPIRVNRPKGG